MKWEELYTIDKIPSFEQISKFINTPYWQDLTKYIEDTYKVEPSIEHSCCTLIPGWNIKYKKSSKSICTIYPKENYFSCMITISDKIRGEIELFIPSCDKYVQEVYKNTGACNGNKWLVIDVTNQEILNDIKELIKIKMQKR